MNASLAGTEREVKVVRGCIIALQSSSPTSLCVGHFFPGLYSGSALDVGQ